MIITMETNKHKKRNRIYLSILAAILAIAAVLVLCMPVRGEYHTDRVIPKVGQAPVYEELSDGQPCEFLYFSDRDMQVTGMELLMVNTDEAAATDPSVHLDVIALFSSDSEPLWSGDIDLRDLSAGEWSSVPVSFDIQDKNGYLFRFTPYGCDPWFMKVDGYEPGISMGFDVVSDRPVTFADKIPYAIPLVTLAAVISILLLMFGKAAVWTKVKSVVSVLTSSDKTVYKYSDKVSVMIARIMNILFLLLVFAALSVRIYKAAYVDGIYITADSDGYLREAVNLVAGNGFSYEGLAGYKSHFANWPIIYPAMIAGMMLITGADAYLASKYVTIVLLALIIIVLYAAFRDRAWIYSLALLNLGFIQIAYHTWSELPFILFMILFALCLGRILSAETPPLYVYAGLGASALAAFLTRYFGIFLWFAAGLYILLLFIKDRKKSVMTAVSMGVSGVLALAYLVMNKICNGNPTGVSRGTWWDDRKTLTIDLIKSLVTEVFYVFSVEVPKAILEAGALPQLVLVLFVILIVAVLVVLLLRRIYGETGAGDERRSGNIPCMLTNPSMVFIVMAVIYYVMFIIVRYRSSMDTFYFRFFAPATVLLVMGIIGLLSENGRLCGSEAAAGDRNGLKCVMPYAVRAVMVLFGAVAAVSLTAGLMDNVRSIYAERDERTYYDIITSVWDEAYSEIPERSVIIWNPMDFRSSWYRPDVYSGELFMDDTWDDLCDRYYGSDYVCMLGMDAEIIINEGDYDDSVINRIKDALELTEEEHSYTVLRK